MGLMDVEPGIEYTPICRVNVFLLFIGYCPADEFENSRDIEL
jgi:hypothetical protein